MTELSRKVKRVAGPLVVPKAMLNKVEGFKRRRISIVVTDPRSRHVVLTRYPDKYKTWYQSTMQRETDFIPTHVLKAAKIDRDKKFIVRDVDGDVIVRREPHRRKS